MLTQPPVIFTARQGTEWVDYMLGQAFHALVFTCPGLPSVSIRVATPDGRTITGTVGEGKAMYVTPLADGVVRLYRGDFDGDDNMGDATGISCYAA